MKKNRSAKLKITAKSDSSEPVAQTAETPPLSPSVPKRGPWNRKEYSKIYNAKPENKARAFKLRQAPKQKASEIVRSRTRRELAKFAVINVLTDGEGSCVLCGQADIDVLCLDHIDNNGAIYRKADPYNSRGTKLHQHMISTDYEDAKAYQVLCANCNMKKQVLFQRTQV